MRPKKSVNELEETLRESRPPETAVPSLFRQQLRHDLQRQATADSPSALSRRWLLAPVALVMVVIVVFWVGWPRTAVDTSSEINTTRPLATGMATLTPPGWGWREVGAVQSALAFMQSGVDKPIGGNLIMPSLATLTTTTSLEAYEVAVNRLGAFAVADFGGSNILFPENETETVWFVQFVGRWQPFGETADQIEPVRYVGVLVNPNNGQIAAAGSSTVSFVSEPIVLAMADYPPRAVPYHIKPDPSKDSIWLVNTGEQIHVFDPRSPYRPDLPSSDLLANPCFYIWAEANGDFEDPCSGDAWFIDGRLNFAESGELWSNRNLDQYRVEVHDNAILVHLDEIVLGEVVAPVSTLGTLSQPQTDFDIIIEQVNTLAGRRRALLSSQSGWLHTSFEQHRLVDGNQGLMNSLYPTEEMVDEQWIHVGSNGRYDQQIAHYIDANGNQTQAGVFLSGHYVNLTLNEIFPAEGEWLPLPNEAAQLVTTVTEMHDNPNNSTTISAYMAQEDGRFLYYVQATTTYDQPISMVITNTTQQVVGDEMRYAFDLNSGETLVQETTFLMPNSEYLVNFHPNPLIKEWITELPEEAADLLAQAEAMLANPEQATGSYTWDVPTPASEPNPQPVLASATLYGVTFSVMDVKSENEVTLRTLAQVDPSWDINVNAFPPQQALTRIDGLSDGAGRPFTPTQSIGELAEMDIVTGGIKQGYTHHFSGELVAGEGLVLATAVDLTNILRVITLPFTLDDAEVGQTWPLDWQLPVGEAELKVTEATWLSNTDSGEAQLRLKVVDSSPAEINVYCLHIAVNDPWQETCANFEGEKEYSITVPQNGPIELHLRISLQVNGFELQWQP